MKYSRKKLRKVRIRPHHDDKLERMGYFHEWALLTENVDGKIIVVTKGLVELMDGYIYPMDPRLVIFTDEIKLVL